MNTGGAEQDGQPDADQGRTPDRRRAIAHAKALRAAITSRQEIYFVDIALAKVADGASEQAWVSQNLGTHEILTILALLTR